MSSFQYGPEGGNRAPISFRSFTTRSDRDLQSPQERYKADRRPVVSNEPVDPNQPNVPVGADATFLADMFGQFGVELYSGSFVGNLALSIADKATNWMRNMPDDPALNYLVNFTDDVSRAGPGLEGINNKSHIIKRLQDAGIPVDMWPEIVGDDPDSPKTYDEFERALDIAILTNPKFVEAYGGSVPGLAAGIVADTAGLYLSGEMLGVPVATAVGNAIAPAGVSVALNAVRSAVGWGVSSSLQTALYQSIREGVNPYSRPDLADLLFEQGLSIGIGAGVGAIPGLVTPVLRGTVEDVPITTVVDNTAIVPAGAAPGSRRPVRVQNENLSVGLLPSSVESRPVEYRLRLTGRYGEVAWDGMDHVPMRASTAGILERLDDVADDAFSLHQSGRSNGTNIVNEILDAIKNAGGTTDPFLARSIARSSFIRYANGERGETLVIGILDDIRPAVGDDVINSLRNPAKPSEAAEVTTLALRPPFNTDIPVLSDKLPSRGPILDLVDIANDPVRSKTLAKHSGATTILSEIRKATGTDITVRQADAVLSDLSELVQTPGENVRQGIRNILAKHAPNHRISVTNALVRQVTALSKSLNNQTNATQLATATTPSASAQTPNVNASPAPSGSRPPANQTTTTQPGPNAPIPPSPDVPEPLPPDVPEPLPPDVPEPLPPDVPPSFDQQRDLTRNLNSSIPFITWTQGGSVVLNQSASALRDTNPLVRMVGLLANARRILQTPGGGNVQQEWSILEEGTHNLNRRLVDLNTIINRRRRQWMMGGDSNSRTVIERHITRELVNTVTPGAPTRRQFNQQIIANVRSGASTPGSTNPIDVASDEIRNWMRGIYDQANALGVPGFRSPWDPKYFPRVWDWDALIAIAADETGANRQALIRWAEEELATTTVGGVPARQVVFEDGTVEVYTDVPQAAIAFVNALQDIATAAQSGTNVITKQSHIFEWETQLLDALNNISGPLRPGAPAGTSSVHGRPRTMMRETTVVNLPNPVEYKISRVIRDRTRTINSISVANLTSDDLPYVMRKYAVSVQAAINEQKALAFFNSTLDTHNIVMIGDDGMPTRLTSLGQIAAQANRMAGQFPGIVGKPLSNSRLEVVNNILDALRYRPIMDLQRMGGLHKAFEEFGSFVHTAVYLTTGGGFGLTSVPEIVRSISMLGFRNFLKQAPHVAIQFARGWRNMDDPTRSAIAAIQALTNPNVDRKLKQLYFAGAADESMEFGNVARNVGNRLGSAFADLTGMGPITSLYQGMTNMMTLTHLVDVGAGRVQPMDLGTLKLLGLSQEQYTALTQWANRNVVMERGLLFEHPVNINNTNDPEFFQLIGFLDRAVRHNIQDVPTRTDFHKWMFSGIGQIVTLFRKFNIKGIDNFMFSNLDRMRFGDMRSSIKVIKTMLATGIAGGLVWYARRIAEQEQARASRNFKRAFEIEQELLTDEAFYRASVDSMTELWLPIVIGESAYRALNENEKFMSNNDPSLFNPTNLPQWRLIENIHSVSGDVQGEMMQYIEGLGFLPRAPEGHRDFTIDSANKMWRLLPGNNIPFLGEWAKETFVIQPMRDAYMPESQYREPSASQKRKTTRGYIQ